MLAERIGPYRIIGKLGEGGMGEVFEAVHETIERHVAIKILRPDRARNPEVATRFFNEARAVNRIQHPGLVQISDCGETDDGSIYIVMELLRGDTLGQRLKAKRRLGVYEVMTLFRQMASALVAVHDKGIVHRDLKPDNMMLVSDPEQPGADRVKLLDFGIAKLTVAGDTGHIKTASDVLIGTPRYMSPEQCRGNREIDEKSDVYSLGVVIYQLLSGRAPFEASGSGEVIAMHIYEPVPPLAKLVPDAPESLLALTHRMLSKRKRTRPSMRQVLTSVDEILEALGPPPRIVPNAMQEMPPDPPQVEDASGLTATLGVGVGQSEYPQAPPTGSSDALTADAIAAAVAAQPSDTIGDSPGQSDTRKARPMVRWVAVGVAALVLVGTVQVVRTFVSPTSPGATSIGALKDSATKSTRTVRWSLRSQPSGAEVVRASDGAVLGQTPWMVEQPAATGQSDLRLRLSGYVERRLSLERSSDANREEILDVERRRATSAAKLSREREHEGSGKPARTSSNRPATEKRTTKSDRMEVEE